MGSVGRCRPSALVIPVLVIELPADSRTALRIGPRPGGGSLPDVPGAVVGYA